MAFEKERLAQAAAREMAKNVELLALLAEIKKEIEHALISDAPAEVLEALLLKIEKANG